jgi:uncharacterized protein YbaR (Trm112 family)
MPRDSDNNHEDIVKAGALICPTCCVAYIETQFDFEFDGIILHNVKTLKCPVCKEELFTPEQQETIQERIRKSTQP